MKELLKKGDAEIPKRTQSIANNNLPPVHDRSLSIGGASFKAAGYVNYFDQTNASTAKNGTLQMNSGLQSPSSSVPAPV